MDENFEMWLGIFIGSPLAIATFALVYPRVRRIITNRRNKTLDDHWRLR